MRPPCELVVRYVLPAFRSLIAKDLVENHRLSQLAAAKKLGTTQAAASYYPDAKRGDKIAKRLEWVPSIQSAAKQVARGIASEKFSFTDSTTKFCELCTTLRKSDVVCDLHHNCTALPENCNICPDMSAQR